MFELLKIRWHKGRLLTTTDIIKYDDPLLYTAAIIRKGIKQTKEMDEFTKQAPKIVGEVLTGGDIYNSWIRKWLARTFIFRSKINTERKNN